ncbi:hypothetical protein NPIL_354311 [Nephila pilipes]|uniref:Uncharacterized protein n=1 Tax=Nephila pilipes TaxID=299642 RepID=A0A8X6TH70_NEPPI|nr:hypothetical protein NPIL_354311 [Nephila pilipes]
MGCSESTPFPETVRWDDSLGGWVAIVLVGLGHTRLSAYLSSNLRNLYREGEERLRFQFKGVGFMIKICFLSPTGRTVIWESEILDAQSDQVHNANRELDQGFWTNVLIFLVDQGWIDSSIARYYDGLTLI